MKIYSIHSDSRYVKPYSIFFCIEGLSVDGHRYIDDAIFQGAKVIVHSKDIEKQQGIIYIRVADPLDELNRVSNVFYDYPSKKMRIVGVTGTSGKTVVASMVKNVMDHYCKAAYMGTISLEYDGVEEECPYTTPETLYVQKKLFDMARRGVKVVAMEASSHGLALKRIDAVDFNIGRRRLRRFRIRRALHSPDIPGCPERCPAARLFRSSGGQCSDVCSRFGRRTAPGGCRSSRSRPAPDSGSSSNKCNTPDRCRRRI